MDGLFPLREKGLMEGKKMQKQTSLYLMQFRDAIV